jgi:hypothetical protein
MESIIFETKGINKLLFRKRGEKMAMKIGGMKISGLIAGIILTVLGALMMAEAVVTTMGNSSFMFAENMNREFEFVVGLVSVVVAAMTMDLNRS